jgi:hypothetical protein
MKKKKIILIVAASLLVFGGIYGAHEFFRRNPDMATLQSNFKLTAADFLYAFDTNDSLATKKYIGKIIEVTGTVRKVEKDDQNFYTVVLSNGGNLSSVRCAIDSAKNSEVLQVKEGTGASVKGIFTGYNKDETGLLGSDAQLDRCVIISATKK